MPDGMFQEPEYTNGLAGRDRSGRRRTYTEEQARAQGTDGFGMPTDRDSWGSGWSEAPPAPTHAPRRAPVSRGSKKINALVDSLDSVELDSGTTIHEFFEAVRNLAHQIGFQVELGLADIEARAEMDAKKDSPWYAMGIDVAIKMRKVRKQSRAIVDSLADAAGAAVKTWSVIETEIVDPMLEAQGRPRRKTDRTLAWME